LNYQTTYTYDLMDKLLTSVQVSQTRTFTYDSFSNIYSEANPENGTITYQYAYSSGGSYCGGTARVNSFETLPRELLTFV